MRASKPTRSTDDQIPSSMSTWPIPKIGSPADAGVRKAGVSGPALVNQIPIPSIPNYLSKFDPDDPRASFAVIGIKCLDPVTTPVGNGHVVPPGSIDIAMRDGVQYALLPGKHAWRTMWMRFKPFRIQNRLTFGNGVGESQQFDGGFKVTVGPNQVGLVFNVPRLESTDKAGLAAGRTSTANAEMGGGVVLLPPGIWLARSPVTCAFQRFEVSTTSTPDWHGSFVQQLAIDGMSAKPRLMYVPYNHSAMFIDGNDIQICDQGFHWASPGIEIAGPWPHAQQRLTFEVEGNTLDNILLKVEVECWVQMIDPETYVRMAGKETQPFEFVESKMSARIKQHVAQIHALSAVVKHEGTRGTGQRTTGQPEPAMGELMPVLGELPLDQDEQLITTQVQKEPDAVDEEENVMSRMKSIIHEVRGFIDGRSDSPYSLAVEAQHVVGEVGLQIIQVAALMVKLPPNIAKQMTDANEQTIRAQTEMGISEARAEQHIAGKLNEIRKKKVDRDEEMRDAENQVSVQRAQARLAEAEEFAKRQAKRAEQKVEQALEMQALEHKQVREQKRIETEMILLSKEKELLELQEEMEERRLAIEKKKQQREAVSADIEAYNISTVAKAERERVNQQTLVDSIMGKLGTPLQGSKIVNFVGDGGSGGASGSDCGLVRSIAPQVMMVREILGQTDMMLNPESGKSTSAAWAGKGGAGKA